MKNFRLGLPIKDGEIIMKKNRKPMFSTSEMSERLISKTTDRIIPYRKVGKVTSKQKQSNILYVISNHDETPYVKYKGHRKTYKIFVQYKKAKMSLRLLRNDPSLTDLIIVAYEPALDIDIDMDKATVWLVRGVTTIHIDDEEGLTHIGEYKTIDKTIAKMMFIQDYINGDLEIKDWRE